MKAGDLKPGERFRLIGKPDPESPVRVCLTNNPKEGLRFGFPNKPGYWCYMGDLVDVEKEDQDG